MPWWKTVLLTPALLVLFGGGIGTAVPALWHEYRAWRLGVETSRLQIYEDQKVLWERNLGCLRVKPVYTIMVDDQVEIGVTLCGTGDALLRYQRSPSVVAYTWVRFPEHLVAPEVQHSSRGDVGEPAIHMVWNQTRCITQYDVVIVWVRNEPDGQAMDCSIEYVGSFRGIMRRREMISCAVCAG